MSISGIFGNLSMRNGLRGLGRTMSRSYLSRMPIRDEKAVELHLGKIGLLVAAGGALIYQHANEWVKTGGDRTQWLKNIAEAVGSFFVVTETSGVYPTIAIGRALWGAGKQPDALSKIQEIVRVGVLMTLGYIGIHLGTGFSEAMSELDEMRVRTYLDSPSVKEWLAQAKASGEPDAKKLAEVLEKVDSHLKYLHENRLRGKLKVSDMDAGIQKVHQAVEELVEKNGLKEEEKVIKKLRAGISDLSQEALDLIYKPDIKHLLPREGTAAKLVQVIKKSEQGYVKVIKALNPIFSHIIFAGLIGLPLVKFLNDRIAERFPNLKGQDVDQNWERQPPDVPGAHQRFHGPSLHAADVGQRVLI